MSARSHERLCEVAERALGAVHQDRSVPSATTMRTLKELREYLDELIQSVAGDLECQKEFEED